MSAPIPGALGPDPVVWQRDELLDLDAIRRRLASRLGAGGPIAIGSCRRTCVSYAVRKRLRVLYEIEVADNRYHIAASSFRSGTRSERAYDRALESAHGCGPLKPVLHDAELEAVFWTFPNDRRLRALRAAAEPSRGPARLLDGRWAKSELVDYYPEASAVVRCLDDSGETVAFAKVHAGEEGARTHRAQRALVRAARGSSLRLAHPLAYSSDHRMLLVEPIRGRAIGRLTGRDLSKGLFAYGAALATLHSLPLDHVPAPSRPQLERLKRKARDIGVVRPDIEARGNELLAEISERWPAAQDAPVFVHGDANANNAILQDGRVALIDFDRASSGEAASDLGNFLGLLAYFRSVGVFSRRAEVERATTFMRGYASVRALPNPASLRMFLSASLTERAFRAVNRVRPKALLRAPQLLEEGRSLLQANGALF